MLQSEEDWIARYHRVSRRRENFPVVHRNRTAWRASGCLGFTPSTFWRTGGVYHTGLPIAHAMMMKARVVPETTAAMIARKRMARGGCSFELLCVVLRRSGIPSEIKNPPWGWGVSVSGVPGSSVERCR